MLFKNKKKKDNWWLWFTLGLISYLLIAPNTTVIRVLVGTLEPMEFTFLRGASIVLVSLPFIIMSVHKFNKRNLTYTLGSGLCMAIAAISLTYAVSLSDASYTVIMSLLSPILLVILSSKLMGDKITVQAAAGVAIAAAGAMVIVLAPLVLSGNATPQFYPVATALMLVNSIFFTLGIILSRKSNEAGMPLTANGGLLSVVIAVISFVGMFVTKGSLPVDQISQFSPQMWLGIFYSGIVVVFIARIMNIAAYERIGSATLSGLNYLGTIVGVFIPVLFLGEKPSITILLGGILIFFGVFLTEKHRAKHHKYIHHVS